jgi:thioredoxin reductase
MHSYTTELAVIGSGPAGLGAAIEAARSGVETILIDENMKPGGQMLKQIHKFFGSHRHYAGTRGYRIGEKLLAEVEELKVATMLNTVAFGFFQDNTIGIYNEGKVSSLKAKKVIIATGAIENPMKFKGWTLPGVIGAGAVQTMMNLHGVLPGKKVLMIGSGNVGLIVSYQLLQAGADVVALVEAKPEVTGWHVHAAKIRRLGVPIYLSHSVLEAEGSDYVEGAIISEVDDNFNFLAGTERRVEVDQICIAVGLRPLIELARLADCSIGYIDWLGGFLPLHNEYMQTSKSDVYVAGDITGIEEASTALEEGRLAGISCAYSLGKMGKESYEMASKVINSNMMDLRIGSFGVVRKRGKEEIYKRYDKFLES